MQSTQMSKSNSNSRQILGGICVNTLASNNRPNQSSSSSSSSVVGGGAKTDKRQQQQLDAQSVLQIIYQQQQHNEQTNAGQPTASSTTRYKTELCRSFQETGICKYGDKCQFAHGHGELRNMVRHPKYKTELCRTFHATGYCPYGPRCHFVHDTEIDVTKQQTTTSTTTNIKSSQISPKQLTVKLTSVSASSSSSSSNSSGSSSSSSSSTSSSSTSPLSLNQFQLDEIDSLFVKTANPMISGAPTTASLLMCADTCGIVKNRKESTSSSSSSSSSGVYSSFFPSTNTSPPSSRSLSPDLFMGMGTNFGYASTVDCDDDEDDFKSTDLIVNQILSNIYLDSSSTRCHREKHVDELQEQLHFLSLSSTAHLLM